MRRAGLSLLLLVASACVKEAAPAEPTCGDAAACMVEGCAVLFDDLQECLAAVDVDADADACPHENLAHARCTEACSEGHSEEEAQAAFEDYLCDVADDPGDECVDLVDACEG